MKYAIMKINENEVIVNIIKRIKKSGISGFNIMEVCGTHTQNISKFGIRNILYPEVNLISGPGCPVCVTSEGYIDAAIKILQIKNVIAATFGDLMKVKGSRESLMNEREKGKRINVIYSPMDALKIADENKNMYVVFLAVGFETTAPSIAFAIKAAKENNIDNFYVLSGIKTMRPVLHKILSDKDSKIDGIICPGHVAVIKGSEYFRFITDDYNIPAVVAGFTSFDIMSAIYFLVNERNKKEKHFENLYKSCVLPYGNKAANKIMDEVFESRSSVWRGIGKIEDSGLYLNDKYKKFDASIKFNVNVSKESSSKCICSEIILGKKLPRNCKFFGKKCTPESPLGPCMVSSEGTCFIFYRYGGIKL